MFNEPSNIIFLAYFVICINLMKNFLGSRTVTPRKITPPNPNSNPICFPNANPNRRQLSGHILRMGLCEEISAKTILSTNLNDRND